MANDEVTPTAPGSPTSDAPAHEPPHPERNARALRLTRDLDLLRGLASEPSDDGVGVVQLATMIGRDKSQVSRSLRALVETGLVERDATTGRYQLGIELYALAAATAQRRLLTAVPEELRRLAAETGETAHVCTLYGTAVVILRSESPPNRATAWGTWEGATTPAHATSSGRVLLAGLSPAALRARYADVAMPSRTSRTRATSIDDLAVVLAEIRSSGCAIVRGENEEGAIGIAAPVFDFRGDRVAAINISGEQALLDDRAEDLCKSVAGAAARVSRLLGARTSADGSIPRRPT